MESEVDLEDSAKPSSLQRLRLGTTVVVGGPAIFLGVQAFRHRWTIDDAFIFFRVVSQIQHGHGPVYNAGERIEVATSPLWLALLTVARLATPAGFSIEWIALSLSILAAVFAVVAIGVAGLRLTQLTSGERTGTVVPFGTLVVVAIPAFWDYATSGLETALALAWLAGSFWVLVEFARGSRTHRPVLPGLLIGLGPLVRPDLAIFSMFFFMALMYIDHGRVLRGRLAVVVATAALPIAYQLFRMGYYAATVPNTALAKEASSARWSRGLAYAKDFLGAYGLIIPLLVVVVGFAILLGRLRGLPSSRDWRIVILAPAVGAAVHALYVVRIGGDYMHARMLLPSLFAAMMPVALIEIRDVAAAVIAGAIVIWGLVCATSLRPPTVNGFVSDQRMFAIELTQRSHPVTLNDYRRSVNFFFYPTWSSSNVPTIVIPGVKSYLLDRNGKRIAEGRRELPLAPDINAKHGFAFTAIGALGYALGPDVFVVDRVGLADPIGSRLSGFPNSMPTGQLHYMTLPWIEARYVDPLAPDPSASIELERQQAVRALSCGANQRLVRDVTGKLTVSRFLGNIIDSPANTSLRIPLSTEEAEQSACGGR